MFPTTSNFAAGLAVPIPTLPVDPIKDILGVVACMLVALAPYIKCNPDPL